MTTRRWLLVVVAAAAVLLLVGRTLAGTYVDYLWYESMGASALWRVRAMAGAILGVGSAAFGALFAYANLYAVRHSVISLIFPRRVGNLEIGEEVPNRYLMLGVAGLSLLLGVLLALPQDAWSSLVLADSGTLFGETETYIGADLGFFVYWLPLENTLWNWAFLVVVVVGASVVLLYALTPSLRWQRGSLYASTYVRRHVTVLVGAFLLLLAWAFRLDMYALLSAGSGADGAFTYADYRVGLPGNLMLSLATLAAALLVIWAGFAGQLRLAGAAVIGVVVAALVVRQVVPALVERRGTPSERVRREQPYQGSRASYTSRAYGVDLVRQTDSTIAYPSLTAAVPWVPIWDAQAIARIADGNRPTPDPYTSLGWHTAATGLVADVLEPPTTPAPRAPWSVMHLLASSADEHGGPVRVTNDGTPTPEDSPIELPLVYPGASTFVIVPDSMSRIAGTPLESVLARIAYAWSLQNFRLLFTDLQQPHPTIVARRDVRDRVGRLTPFFAQGRAVEPILVGDSLYWSLDLYAASQMYPLSRHYSMGGDELTYLHHAATAIVLASTGDVSIVPDSVLDPIADTWVKRLPSLFSEWKALPPALRALQPPATDGVLAQAAAFGRHGTRADRDIVRRSPASDGADTALAGPRVFTFALPDRTRAVAYPLVDESDHLHGLFIGVGGATRATLWYPLPTLGPRWSTVLERLRSLDSAGSAAREGPLAHGPVRAIPVRGGVGVAFIQPTYRWRAQTMPSLNRVAALVGDTVRSLSPTGIPPVFEVPPRSGDLRANANALYAQMRDALRRGDWVAFGRAFDALGRALADSGRRR